MGYTSFLKPRTETLAGEIEGIIDLANLGDTKRRKLEARPDQFFALTYPTADVRHVVNLLDQRFAGGGPTPGLFLFEGLKGSGKSHLLLLVYHLFKNPPEARKWLERHGLTCRLPDGVIPVVNKFTDLPLLSIWDFVLREATGRSPAKSVLQPSFSEVETALGGRQVILIFDELEQGIKVLPDQVIKAQNIAFLQMLSEWAHRTTQVTLFASIYSEQEEPGATLKRVSPCRVQFSKEQDKARVVLHRVFENYLDFKPESVASVVDSYLNVWRKHAPFSTDDYRQAMLDSYPFTPDLMEIMLRRVPARGGFQNVRGALGFLAHMVRLTHGEADIVTPGNANIQDREVAIRLSDLDPGSDLITRAQGNLAELKAVPFAMEVASATLLYTLTGIDARTHGVTREELVRSALRPGVDINEFERSLLAFGKYASYFHMREGRYFFDREENADAKVEFYSLKVSDDRAREELRRLWKDELLKEPAAVIWRGVEDTRAALEALEKDRLRWVLGPRRLTDEDRQAVYHGLAMRNQVILLEPRDDTFTLEGDPDLLKWAKRLLAVDILLDMKPDASRRAEYDRLVREDRKNILDRIRRAGLIYVKFEAQAGGLGIEGETLGAAVSKEDVITHLSQKVYPPQLVAEHMADRLEQIKGRPVRDVDREYRSTLGFPVLTHASSVTRAVRLLCGARKLSVYHNRGNFCGGELALSDPELMDATLREPFEAAPLAPPSAPVAVPPQPRPMPPGGGPAPPRHTVGQQTVRRTGQQPGISGLRQAAAAILQENPSAKVVKARFVVFLDKDVGDLSTLPAALRGSLAGPGGLTAEIALTKEGDFSKAELEQMIERLPNVPGADYSVDLTLLTPPEGGNAHPGA